MTKNRIPMEGGDGNWGNSPFSGLEGSELSSPPPPAPQPVAKQTEKSKGPNLGRVEVRRETSGRAGKAVTTIREFRAGSSKASRTELLREFKKKLAVGGFLRPDGGLEIQGDHREIVTKTLLEKGYQPVQAGG